MNRWNGWDLPFFDARHEALTRKLQEWVAHDVRQAERIEALALNDQCRHYLQELASFGFLQLAVPDAHRGEKHDVRSICLVREALGYRSAIADFVFSMQGIGTAAILFHGSAVQKAKYLASCREGRTFAALALTEPDGGSDLANMRTRAERQADGSYRINGTKAWISNGGIAGHYIVVVRTGEQQGARGLSAFLLDADTPGLRTGPNLDIVSPHPLSEVFFENVVAREDQLLGAPGEGFKVAMATLDTFRASVGAAAVGMARRALDETAARMHARTMFGRSMADMDTVQMKVADMALDVDTAAMTVYRAGWAKDVRGGTITREASMAKIAGTEAAQRAVDGAMQLFGAAGLRTGCVLERLYRDVRPMRIYEGASEVQRIVIGRRVLAAATPKEGKKA